MKDLSYCDQIMGCELNVSIIAQNQQIADHCFTEVLDTAMSYEKQFSRFDANSELSSLNQTKTLKVSAKFLQVFQIAQNLYHTTQKIFNPLLQAEAIGYNKSFEKLSKHSNLRKSPTYNYDFSQIKIINSTIHLQPTQKLDFGGFLKGYLSAQIAQTIIKKQDVGGIIINIGGDLTTRGVDEYGQPFAIDIYNPISKTEYTVIVNNQSLCTSGSYKRTWKNNGKRVSHIICPQKPTGELTDYLSATVLHSDGALADAFATTLLTNKNKQIQQILKTKQTPFLLIAQNGIITKYLI